MEGPCVRRGTEAASFSCPVDNSESGTPADLHGDLPEQVCLVCGVSHALVDQEPRRGAFRGVLRFGPVSRDGDVDESDVSEYRVYAVDENGTRIGKALTSVPKQSASWGDCCHVDSYSVSVSLDLAGEMSRAHHLKIVIVSLGVELPVGAESPLIADRTTGTCDESACGEGSALRRDAQGSECQGFACTEQECCTPLPSCSAVLCSAAGSDFLPKASPPSSCGNRPCTEADCCELAPGAIAAPQQGAASSTVALVAILAILGAGGALFVARRVWKRRRKSDEGSQYLSQVVPVDGDTQAGPPHHLGSFLERALDELDVEAAARREWELAREEEHDRKQAELEGFLQRSVAQLHRNAEAKAEEECCNILLGVLQTITEHPDDLRFHRLDLSNEILATKVFSVTGAQALLEKVGFRLDKSGMFLVLKANAPLCQLDALRSALESRLAELWEENFAKQVPELFPADAAHLELEAGSGAVPSPSPSQPPSGACAEGPRPPSELVSPRSTGGGEGAAASAPSP